MMKKFIRRNMKDILKEFLKGKTGNKKEKKADKQNRRGHRIFRPKGPAREKKQGKDRDEY